MLELTPAAVLGLDEKLLCENAQLSCRLQAEVIVELQALAEAAARAGFCLQVASSYRSFERQLLIWNDKALGRRPLLDGLGQPLDVAQLSQEALLWAILRWSALPGASRHHWGTDVDVYDSSRMAPEYQLQLTQAETQGDGPCAEFHQWLTRELASAKWRFYRPYDQDRGGVAPEPWHLSYAPLARQCAQLLTLELLAQQIAATDIELKSVILAHLPDIYNRFIKLAN